MNPSRGECSEAMDSQPLCGNEVNNVASPSRVEDIRETVDCQASCGNEECTVITPSRVEDKCAAMDSQPHCGNEECNVTTTSRVDDVCEAVDCQPQCGNEECTIITPSRVEDKFEAMDSQPHFGNEECNVIIPSRVEDESEAEACQPQCGNEECTTIASSRVEDKCEVLDPQCGNEECIVITPSRVEDKHETMDCQPQCGNEFCRIITPSGVEGICEESDQLVPCVGMTFVSEHQAYEFYKSYAMRMGFGISRMSSRYSKRNYALIAINFVCVRYGQSKAKEITEAPRPSLKTGCQAMIRLKINNVGKWVIVKVLNEHNHELDPTNAPLFRSFRKVTTPGKSRFKVLDASRVQVPKIYSLPGKQAGGISNAHCREKGCRKYLREFFSISDARALYEYMIRKKTENPSFFYAIEVDDDQRLRNLFWVDGRSRVDYQYFGDVVSFDTRYLLNRYEMPFASFVGVNHHQQSILFGCALVREETISSFVWLFSTWLQAMGGKSPLAIITNQDQDIRAAITQVFPTSYHRFCLQHIIKKVPDKLEHVCKSNADFLETLHGCIYDSRTVKEFEERWHKMIEGYELAEDEWLRSLYEDRSHWVPTFLSHIFWAGMSTSQRDESIDHFFDTYASWRTSLREFLEKYELAIQNRWEKEAQAEFDSHKKQQLRTTSPFEAQVATVYTREIFGKFVDELLACNGCHIIYVEEKEAFLRFVVRDVPRQLDYTVDWCLTEQNISCDCHLFNFRGFLCRHTLVSLLACGIYLIPSRFILERWSRNAKIRHIMGKRNALMDGDCPERRSERVTNLCMQALSFAEGGCLNKETYDIAVKALSEAFDKIVLASGRSRLTRTLNECSQGKRDAREYGQMRQEIMIVEDPLQSKKKRALQCINSGREVGSKRSM